MDSTETSDHSATNTPDVAAPIIPVLPASPLELQYAPPLRSSNRVWLVLLAGLLTTALTLAGEYALTVWAHVHVMGWYADYIIPVGAICLGMAASSGYALTAWWLGIRIQKGLLGTIVVLMFCAYFAAEYVEFRSRGPLVLRTGTVRLPNPKGGAPLQRAAFRPLGFWHYFHLRAVNWTWKHDSAGLIGSKPQPLGLYGYIFVALGIIGFALSGLIWPAAIGRRPYCELCQRYMKKRSLILLPASMPYRKFAKKQSQEAQAYQSQHQLVHKRALERLQRLSAAAESGDASAFQAVLAEPNAPAGQANKLPRRLAIAIMECVSCASGYLEAVSLAGQGKQLKRSTIAKKQLDPTFVNSLRTKPRDTTPKLG